MKIDYVMFMNGKKVKYLIISLRFRKYIKLIQLLPGCLCAKAVGFTGISEVDLTEFNKN